MDIAIDDMAPSLWVTDDDQMWLQGNLSLLVARLYFSSAFFNTEQLVRALSMLGGPTEPWFLPYEDDEAPQSKLWYLSPTKMC